MSSSLDIILNNSRPPVSEPREDIDLTFILEITSDKLEPPLHTTTHISCRKKICYFTHKTTINLRAITTYSIVFDTLDA